MKWLILTDDSELETKCTDFLNTSNKKDKVICSPLKLESLKGNKKNFKELASCIIYANDEKGISAPLGAALSSIFGFFASLRKYSSKFKIYDSFVFLLGSDIQFPI